jgi:cytochrome c oxidase subunit 2
MPALALAAWMSAGCATAGGAPVAESGETVFNNYCAPCHGVDGTGIDVAKAPSIAGLPEWYIRNQVDGFRTGLRGTHYDDVQGMRMRPMALTLAPDEIDGVIKHAASLPAKAPAATLVGGDATKGAGLYATCQACHGADGKGNEALGAPPLTYTHDWYLANQLHNFKQGIRGANPKDTRGATMRPMAATLADEQAIKDVLAYVATLPK